MGLERRAPRNFAAGLPGSLINRLFSRSLPAIYFLLAVSLNQIERRWRPSAPFAT